MRDEFMSKKIADVNRAAPYYARGEKADDQLRVDLARAGSNMFLVDRAWKEHSRAWEKVRDDAAKAGVPLVGSGLYPSEGEAHYNRTEAERQFLVWNDALEAVEGRERQQRRRGWMLDRVAPAPRCT